MNTTPPSSNATSSLRKVTTRIRALREATRSKTLASALLAPVNGSRPRSSRAGSRR